MTKFSLPFLILSLISVLLFIGVEIILRQVWGIGDMVLFQSDDAFEYIAQPNQERVRFGNRIMYNEFSMRSEPLASHDKCVILGFGDSVINGGTLTDHDSLATTLVENELNDQYRFLSISAGSWGPDNCAAYLQKLGDFNAKMIVLFVSSHDARDNMTFKNIVGHHEGYPDKQYPLAVLEVFSKYLLPKYINAASPKSHFDPLLINKHGVGLNPGFDFFYNYAKQCAIPLLICLHLEVLEIEKNQFNEKGAEILSFCKANNIKVITGLEVGEKESHYRDNIHLNEQGQKLWAGVLLNEIKNTEIPCP